MTVLLLSLRWLYANHFSGVSILFVKILCYYNLHIFFSIESPWCSYHCGCVYREVGKLQ